MGRPVDEIQALYKQRLLALGPVFGEMREVGMAFENKLVVPLPELDRNERSTIPNLIQQGITAKAQRVGAVVPNLDYPVVRPGIKTSEEASRHRRMANLGWWEFSDMEIVLPRRARHLIAYTTTPVKVSPNFELGIPQWAALDPLGCFPAPPAHYDDMMRRDVILAYASRAVDLKRDYPEKMGWLFGAKGDEQVQVLEYIDENERVLLAVGSTNASVDLAFASPLTPPVLKSQGFGTGRDYVQELDRQENRAGVCWMVVPGTISLDKPVNRYASMIGTHMGAAKLQALETIGIQSGVIPKTYFVQTETQGGIIAEAKPGQLGHVKGGRLETMRVEPSLRPDAALDRYERTMRIDGGIPAATSGESQTGVRTGRLGDSLLSNAIDPDIAEDHTVLQRSMRYECEVAVAIAKGYAPDRPVSFHVNWKGSRGAVTYKAGDLFPSQDKGGYAPAVVEYPVVGADQQQLVVGGGQRLGLKTMSRLSFMKADPMVHDAEWEHDQIIAEGLEDAMLAGLQQRAQSDPSFVDPLARIMQAVRSNSMELAEAYLAEQKRVQEQQATSGPPGSPTGPVDPNSPEAQPGLGVEGGAAVAGTVPPIQAPPEGLSALNSILRDNRTVRSEMRAG